jgi:hypothetical protein
MHFFTKSKYIPIYLPGTILYGKMYTYSAVKFVLTFGAQTLRLL